MATDYFVQIYLDDILLLTISKDRSREVSGAMLELLRDLGVLVHPSKCDLDPVPHIDFLGMRLDVPAHLFRLTNKQRDKLAKYTTELLAQANRR